MTPAQYASKFLRLMTFMPLPRDGSAGPTSMRLPDPKRPGVVPGLPLEPARWTPLSVSGYRLTGSGKQLTLLEAVRHVADLDVRVITVQGSIETCHASPADLRFAMMAPFRGKAYPEEMQIALQLWARYGLAPDISTLINSWLIGLDCNGFVGGYLERRDAPSRWLRHSYTKTDAMIIELIGPSSRWLRDWDEFPLHAGQSLLLALCGADGSVKDHVKDHPELVGHLAITEPGTLTLTNPGGPVTVDVVESTGGVGLTRSTYTVESMTRDGAGRGIFRVRRGSKIGTDKEHAWFRLAPAS